MVCEWVRDVLHAKHEVEMIRAKTAEATDIDDADLVVFACPTYGHGELEKYFEIFLGKIHDKDMKGRKCAIIGLGDPKYEPDYVLESIPITMKFLKEKEVELVGMPLRISKCPLPMKQFAESWAQKLSDLI